ncbi:putative E3 ubiquitin-protein ligase MID2 [Branchiostoma floridae x Branchiostoma japonicum]
MLQNIVDRFREARAMEKQGVHAQAPPCQLCEGNPRPTVKVCVTCDVAYCEDCLSTFHPARGPLARHTLVPPGQQPCTAEPKVVMCAEHPDEKVNMYCKEDEMPVCSLCKMVGRHKGHEVTALTDVYQEKKDILMEEVYELKERNKEIGDFVAEIRETCTKVQDKRREWQGNLVRDIARLEETLNERKELLEATLNREEEEKLKLLKDEIVKKEEHLQKAQTVVAYVEEVLKEKDQSCFLQAVKSTRERVKDSKDKDTLVVPADLVFTGFDLSKQHEAMAAIAPNELSTSWKECVKNLSTSSYLMRTWFGGMVRHCDGNNLVDGNPNTYWHSDNSKQTKARHTSCFLKTVQIKTL